MTQKQYITSCSLIISQCKQIACPLKREAIQASRIKLNRQVWLDWKRVSS